MSLEPYRRHNESLCNSTDTIKCANPRRPCPIWVSGTGPDGKFIRQSLRKVTGTITRDWAAASKAIREWEQNGKAPKPANDRATVKQLREDFIAKIEGENLSNETVRKYKTLFDQLDTFSTKKGVRYVDELNYEMLMAFRQEWNDGPLSTSKKLERLRSIMNFAIDREWVTKNAAKMIKSPKVKQSPTLPFTAEEMQTILKTASDPMMRAFILVMRFSGLRISDTAMLAIDRVKDNKITLYQAKTGEPVAVKIPQMVTDELQTMEAKSAKYFFWSGTSSSRTLVSVWGEKLRSLFKKAGIATGHSHRFRDTFAVNLLSAGVSIDDVSTLLGHTNVRITQKHYSPWVKARQAALDAAVEKANGWHELQNQKPAVVLPIRRKRA